MTMRAVFLLLVVTLGLASTAYSARDLASFLRISQEDPTMVLHGKKHTEIHPVMLLEFDGAVPNQSGCGPQCKVCACVIVCVCVSKVDPTMELRLDKIPEAIPVMNPKMAEPEGRTIVLSE